MTQSITDLERDIEESRARLDLTIDRIQGKLSTSGVVDDVIGQVRRSGYGVVVDRSLEAIRNNPVPVLLVVAGFGWLLHRAARQQGAGRVRVYDTASGDGVPVVRTRVNPVYDPDNPTPHPNADYLEPRRSVDARA
ncbi:DUF3618 domain-containing protein [Salinarimonas soli]|uniref:DUF3618 domain-containing protein n=1 Tax=Salinarimonas soli TaxID=1638099 RepID=A0A5B2VE23_9HYPH|nr:DUF3618 domain-containing protein [Salinarimonas soli]KAA2236672.1 DUF3618 domain-containing protein [Salinarimonas soli]